MVCYFNGAFYVYTQESQSWDLIVWGSSHVSRSYPTFVKTLNEKARNDFSYIYIKNVNCFHNCLRTNFFHSIALRWGNTSLGFLYSFVTQFLDKYSKSMDILKFPERLTF